MKKIMIISPGLTGGGAERVSAILANYFITKGFHVVFLALYSDEKSYHLDSLVEYKYVGIRKRNKIFSLLSQVKKIREVIRNNKIDYIVDFSTAEGVLGTIFTNASRVTSLRNDPKNDGHNLYTRFFRILSYSLAKKVVFQTEEAKQYYPKFIQKKGHIVLNPITKDLPIWQLGEATNTIVAAGRLTPQKNFKMLIDAAAIIHNVFQDYKVIIYGDGQDYNSLIQYINQKGMESVVFIKGYIKSIHNVMRSAYIYVSTSDYEGISNSMIEALGIGVPTVCTDCSGGGARAVIADGENGVLVPTKDATALASKILELIKNPCKAQKLSEEARKINKRLDVELICGEWLSIVLQS